METHSCNNPSWSSWIHDRLFPGWLLPGWMHSPQEDNPIAYGTLSRTIGYLRKQKLEARKGKKKSIEDALVILTAVRQRFLNHNPLRYEPTFDRWANGNQYGAFNSDDD